MSKAGLAETEPLAQLANTDVVADALASLGATVLVHAAYQQGLKRRFSQVPLPDRKAAQKHQKVLLAQPALQILMIIWKESPWVGDGAVEAAWVSREFSDDNPINCHSLATRLAEDVSDFERQQKRVQSVVAAGEIYGYIERQPCQTRMRTLVGTDILHEMMVRLGKQARGFFSAALDYDLEPFK
jgi:hypothetical protein